MSFLNSTAYGAAFDKNKRRMYDQFGHPGPNGNGHGHVAASNFNFDYYFDGGPFHFSFVGRHGHPQEN